MTEYRAVKLGTVGNEINSVIECGKSREAKRVILRFIISTGRVFEVAVLLF